MATLLSDDVMTGGMRAASCSCRIAYSEIAALVDLRWALINIKLSFCMTQAGAMGIQVTHSNHSKEKRKFWNSRGVVGRNGSVMTFKTKRDISVSTRQLVCTTVVVLAPRCFHGHLSVPHRRDWIGVSVFRAPTDTMMLISTLAR